MKCIKDFVMEEFLKDVRKDEIFTEDGRLLRFVEMAGGDYLVEKARDFYYKYGILNYSQWKINDNALREFWEDTREVANAAGMDETPNEREAIELIGWNPIAGRDMLATIMTWFNTNGFIRDDITRKNCGLLLYLDSFLILSENIMARVFDEYETIGMIDVIHDSLMKCIEDNLSSHEVRILKKQMGFDEKFHETGVQELLTKWERGIQNALNANLRALSNELEYLIFSGMEE